ncbi:MAG: N-acetyltransferase [Lachnospiraceae bacterium]|nr:N-acetyltransferase [Lachnospiraceae bacterium]
MELIKVTKENLDKEHICCAISSNKDCQVSSKKEWLSKRFEDGLVFLKGNVRGKCFIEYVPAEYAWCPIEAKDYLFIDCLWVSGQFKGQGFSSELLDACISDAKQQGKKGLVIVSATKKMPFLSDPKYLKYKGFRVADSAAPYYVLYYLPFEEGVEKPRFQEQVKNPRIEKMGYILYYSAQCPFTAKYAPLLEEVAKRHQCDFKAIKIESTQQAQESPAVFTTYSLFKDGEFITNEILSEKKFEKMILEE